MRIHLFALMFGAIAFVETGTSFAQTIDLSPANRKSLGIDTASVNSAAHAPESRQFTGTVTIPPGGSAPVSSPFQGVLIEPLVMPGMQVEAGTPVARLYSPDYEAMRSQMASQRLAANHMRELAEQAEALKQIGLRSQQEVDEAHHEASAAALALSTSRRQLSVVDAAEGSGEFTVLAPRAGVVTHILVTPGEAVGRAEPLVMLFDEGGNWLKVPVPESFAGQLKTGQPVELSLTDQPGTIVSIDPEVDVMSRSVDVLVDLPEQGNWRIGQLVDASFSVEATSQSLSVPSRAIVRFGELTAVFVDRGNGVERVVVNVLSQDRANAIVSGPLSIGDRVVVSGLAALKNIVEAS